MEPAIEISRESARRFLLGRQGLWPGRRWEGKAGAAEAIRAIEALQMDPVVIAARSHDLVLWSRVEGYEPDHLADLLYRDRAFFDYGSHLDVYPIEELPFWRTHMERRRADPEQATFAEGRGPLLDALLAAVREHGPLNARDLPPGARIESYRGNSDTKVGLYHLWLTGELMTAERRGFERVYDLRERVAPPDVAHAADPAAAERHFAAKALRAVGLGSLTDWAGEVRYAAHRPLERRAARRWLDDLAAEGVAAPVRIEGFKEPWWMPAADLSLLERVAAGAVPDAWRPRGATTTEEVAILSPLDSLLRRARTRDLFAFEHLWEIYKPAHQRRWGAFTMPVLYDDRLVARLEPKRDAAAGALRVEGFWLEDDATAADPSFAAALARGLTSLAAFLGVERLRLDGLGPEPLRARVAARVPG